MIAKHTFVIASHTHNSVCVQGFETSGMSLYLHTVVQAGFGPHPNSIYPLTSHTHTYTHTHTHTHTHTTTTNILMINIHPFIMFIYIPVHDN